MTWLIILMYPSRRISYIPFIKGDKGVVIMNFKSNEKGGFVAKILLSLSEKCIAVTK